MKEYKEPMVGLDEGWTKSLEWHWSKIKENGGILVLTPEKQKVSTFGVLFEVPASVKNHIAEWLNANISPEFDEYIIRQPSDGYHISLEWTEAENVPAEIRGEVMADIAAAVGKLPAIVTNIELLHASFVNMFAPCLLDNTALEQIRNELRDIFYKHQLRIGIPPETYGAWISLVRYKKQLTPELVSKLQSLPKTTIPEVVLDNILLTVNDPMFTKENSTILDEVRLQ